MFQESQEYRPRFGYKRVNNGVEDQPIVEIKVTCHAVSQAVSRCHRSNVLTAFPLTLHPSLFPLSLSVGMVCGQAGQDPYADPWAGNGP